MSERLGIDTNVLLRLVVFDDLEQVEAVDRLVRQLVSEGVLFINLSVILETHWVLMRRYHYPKEQILNFMQALLERRDFEIAGYEAVGNAVYYCRTLNVDFADALLSEMNRLAGCSKTMTFDKKAAARVPGMELLQ